jgi:hypothetical protein
MLDAVIYVDPGTGGGGRTVVNATASDGTVLQLGKPTLLQQTGGEQAGVEAVRRNGADAGGATSTVSISVRGLARGRSRVQVGFSDGSEAVLHYTVLPPFHSQIAAVAKHWSTVAWLPVS